MLKREFPQTLPLLEVMLILDDDRMNYSVVVTGGVVIFSIIWYYVRGRKEYHGPLIDDEVAAVMRLGSVVAV